MNKDYTIEINESVNTFLDSLSDEELRKIINGSDQDRLDELVEKCPIVPKLIKEKEVLIAKNKSLATSNYEKAPIYNDLRKALETAHKQAVQLKQQINEKQTKLNKLKPKMTPDTLRGLLQVAAQESEEQSEEITKQFLSNKITYEEFINEFIKKRTEHHIRRLKYEKLIESIQNPNSRENNANNSLNQQNKPQTSLNQPNSSNLFHPQPVYPPTNLNHPPFPYPNVSNGPPFAYQPFSVANQPIRAAPLPPTNMMDLPPYSAPSVSFPPSYRPTNQHQSFPFNANPNLR